GKLDNGMTYYIRHNEKPKGQASFYILHDVGAIQENDDQQGLAHFLEHMAFNGTKNLPGKTMINYLEKIGVMFGYNLNAGTSWDYTEYMVKDVPVREGTVDTALMILHDWSYFIALEPSEIDSERGVIMEELRTRDGAGWRSTIAMLKALYKDTRYAERNLIGYLDGLKSFDHSALESFYHTWYRPDYQSIYIIGDIDVDEIEAKIKTLMADIPAASADAPQKEVIIVPDNEEPIISIFADPEMQTSSVRMFAKRQALPKEINNTMQRSIIDLVLNFAMTMEDARLEEIRMKPDAPFISAGMGEGQVFVNPTLESTMFVAQTEDGKLADGFRAIYTEMERMRRHGFTQGEFERAKDNIMRAAERQYNNRNDVDNNAYADRYIDAHRNNYAMPDAETEWQIDSMLISSITVEAVNEAYASLTA
ncbi:MAG: insulinase family protein, partial [Alistipes sp.]|nr:insulinase family protein [Alistipes sp.]